MSPTNLLEITLRSQDGDIASDTRWSHCHRQLTANIIHHQNKEAWEIQTGISQTQTITSLYRPPCDLRDSVKCYIPVLFFEICQVYQCDLLLVRAFSDDQKPFKSQSPSRSNKIRGKSGCKVLIVISHLTEPDIVLCPSAQWQGWRLMSSRNMETGMLITNQVMTRCDCGHRGLLFLSLKLYKWCEMNP